MAYIPKKHLKYNILPSCQKHGGEVFVYPGEMIDKLESYLPDDESMIPYGFDSYEQYNERMDYLASQYFLEEKAREEYEYFRIRMKEMNIKEDWSVLKYVGKSDNKVFGLTHGNIYYWPCSKNDPVYKGVIDNEEFTSYWYSTEPEDWEIIDDPTGIAYTTIYGKAKGYTSKKEYEEVMGQIEQQLK